MSQKTLITSFEILNDRKRKSPSGLSSGDKKTWKRMRDEIETLLFHNQIDPGRGKWDFLQVPVALEVSFLGAEGRERRMIRVLGEGGCIISTPTPLPLGTRMELELFPLKSGFLLKLNGVVNWAILPEDAQAPGMGVAFVDLTVDHKRMVFQIIDHTVRKGILDNRCFPRFDAQLPLELTCQGRKLTAVTGDLSLGGMFVAAELAIEVGSSFSFKIHLIDGETVSGVGEVVHRNQTQSAGKRAGFGVRFLEIEPGDIRKLQRYLILVEETKPPSPNR